jgi:4-hydroxy-tetrahydrodipicolinate synthase
MPELAADEGIDALSVLSPIYWKTTQEEIYAHFCDIIEAAKLPVIAYNIPRNTGNNIDPDTIGRLYRNAGLAGAKDSSGSFENFSGYISSTGGDFLGIVGSDALILRGLEIGAQGAISAPSNMLTKVACAIYDRFVAGDLNGAQDAQKDWDTALNLLRDIGSFPACFKRAVNHFTAPVGIPRRPLRPADEGKFREILPALEEIRARYC